MIPAKFCIACKGTRALCGWKSCPLLARIQYVPQFASISDSVQGPAPSMFIGHRGYPAVFAGPLVSIAPLTLQDNPSSWFGVPYTDIITFRSSMLRTTMQEDVYSRSRFVSDMQELALAHKPPDVEVSCTSKPLYRMNFSSITQPMGPTVRIGGIRIMENVKVSNPVEKIVHDDLSATAASYELYQKDVDLYKITTLLSAGVLGSQERKRLVPTCWSITAMDDILFKQLAAKVKTYQSIDCVQVFSASYLGNTFTIVLLPGAWEFENFETWAPGSFWAQSAHEAEISREYEPFAGRTTYASQQVGGYYAARFAVIEALEQMKKQARVLSIREINEQYVVPLGVWVVRETVRSAMRQKPQTFSTVEEAQKFLINRLVYSFDMYHAKSILFRQRRLKDFLA
ncbi:MAG: hypothetical protein HY832_00310 [Candidatus Aenigmarchaeota archaeon]|nr:hypothetical protein [Candidatus Aenigmarchaeota archaeon]